MKALGDAAREMPEAGEAMHAFCTLLYPHLRSITGDGLRRTLAAIGGHIPIMLTEIASGTQVFDWTVPLEWTLREAHVSGPDGRRVIDARWHTLHVMGYSEAVDESMPLADLKPHLHWLPQHPDWIPWRTSPWTRDWGFCLSQRQLDALKPGRYRVRIDASLEPGSMTLGECLLPGDIDDEVLIYAHCCHPSLANDNLSGIAVATWLARMLAARPHRLSYRFVFGPTTIGSIAWLATHESMLGRIRHGLSLACLGDEGALTYKRSRRGDTATDRIASQVVQRQGGRVLPFEPYGYDERQFCSPGIDLAYGRLTRTPNGCYPQYHTSADDLSLIRPESLAGSLQALLQIVDGFETDERYVNLLPKGEPRLGVRGLFAMRHGLPPGRYEHALLWVLSMSDGERDLDAIAQRSGIERALLEWAASDLVTAGLVQRR